MSYYDVLKVPVTATPDEIKKAYRELAKQHHPDKGGDESRFKEIANAFETLSDPIKRMQYDSPSSTGFDHSYDPFSVFNQFFNDRSSHGTKRNKTQHCDYSISLQDIYTGKQTKLSVTRQDKCKSCNAKGGTGVTACAPCGGSGMLYKHMQMAHVVHRMSQPCHVCKGSGSTLKNKCQVCLGDCIVKNTHVVEFYIPPSSPETSTFFLSGAGDYNMKTCSYSDIVVRLKPKAHPRMKRKGDDLYMSHIITLCEALCGIEFAFSHLDSNTYVISSPAQTVIKPNTIFEAHNLGMNKNGKLYISFEIIFPDKVIYTRTEELATILGFEKKTKEEDLTSLRVMLKKSTSFPRHEEQEPGQGCAQQ